MHASHKPGGSKDSQCEGTTENNDSEVSQACWALSPIELLPDEILLQIFSKLPLPDVLLGARQVCWRWFHLSHDNSLWLNVDFSDFKCGCEAADRRKNSAGVRNLLHSIHLVLERLTFSNLALDSSVYSLFGSAWHRNHKDQFANLKCLDFSYTEVTPRSLRTAISANPDIEELILCYTKISFHQAMLEAYHLPNLKKLVFHDMYSWDCLLEHHQDDELFNIKLSAMFVPHHCPHLEVVELHSIWATLDDEVIQEYTQHCPNLKSLSFIWSSNLTEKAFQNLSNRSHQITELVLADKQSREPYLDFVLPNFPNLRKLSVSGQNVHLNDCIAIGECCPHLRELVFDANPVRESQRMFEVLSRGNCLCGLELMKIAKKCKELRKLHAPCSHVDDDSVLVLAEKCLWLEDVDFSLSPYLTKRSIQTLAKKSRHLKRINFHGVNINVNDLLVLFTNCSMLEEAIFDAKEKSEAQGDILLSPEGSLDLSCSQDQSESETESERTQEECPFEAAAEDIPFIDMSASVEDHELQMLFHNLDQKDKKGKKTTYQTTQQRRGSDNDESVRTCQDECELPILYFPVNKRHCHLRKLSLKDCSADSECLQGIFRECPDLMDIVLDGCISGVTDKTIITLARSCLNLRSLSVSFKPNFPPTMIFGDEGLIELTRVKTLEVLRFLYNPNITPVALITLFKAQSTSMRSLQSLSFCVGHGYSCSISVVALHGLKYLTEKSKRCLKDAAATAKVSSFMLLHLEYQKRRR